MKSGCRSGRFPDLQGTAAVSGRQDNNSRSLAIGGKFGTGIAGGSRVPSV